MTLSKAAKENKDKLNALTAKKIDSSEEHNKSANIPYTGFPRYYFIGDIESQRYYTDKG